jgi:hypothetical protein
MKWSGLCRDAHALLVGGTGRGKSSLLQLITRSIIEEGVEGLIALDPHGSYVRAIVEWAANPGRLGGRGIEFFEFGAQHSWSLNPLDTHGNASPEAAHNAALDLISVVENFFDAPVEQTPRLLRVLYVSAYLCAAKKLSPIEMIELLSLGGEAVRHALLHDFENHIVKRELEELSMLAQKHPARFSEITESARNRFVRLIADRRIARMLGGSRSINAYACLQNRERLLFDLSAIPSADRRFIGALITKVFMSAAHRRVPDRSAPCRLILDEASELLCSATADMVSTCRKYSLYLVAALQYLGQAEQKNPFLLEGLFTNCDVKICMGGLPPAQAKMMTEILGAPFDVQTYKPASLRPTAVGNEMRLLRSASHALHEAEHESRGVATMRSTSRASTLARGSAHTTSESENYQSSEGYSEGESAALAAGRVKSTGKHNQQANSSSLQLGPPTYVIPQTILGQGQGVTSGAGSSEMQSDMASTALSTSSMFSSVDSEGYASSQAFSESESEAETEGESESTAESVAHGTSVGRSHSSGTSQTFVTRYQLLPSSLFGLDELLHLGMAEIMTLPRRVCIIRVADQRAFKTRTADLSPPFKHVSAKSFMLPLFLKSMIVRSKWLRPSHEIDQEIAARFKALTAAAEKPDAPAFASVPIVTDPTGYAKTFRKAKGAANPMTPVNLRVIASGPRIDDVDNDGTKRS